MDTKQEENVWNIRQTAGMVLVLETTRLSGRWWRRMWDSAWKYGDLVPKKFWERVEESLRAVGMYELESIRPINFPADKSRDIFRLQVYLP